MFYGCVYSSNDRSSHRVGDVQEIEHAAYWNPSAYDCCATHKGEKEYNIHDCQYLHRTTEIENENSIHGLCY